MEKTKFTLFMLPAVALFLFVACSGENDLTAETPTAQQKETPSNAIGFDAYLNRTTTRAGWAGELNLTNLQSTGFGVFAYYGDGDLYSENLVPNFMYNQHVTYDGVSTKWTYEPVKYWPNEFGSSAVSTSVDRVSFFAYAPYVAVEPSSGLLTSDYDNTIGTPGEMDEYEKLTETGITWLSRNGKGGDPYVRYVTSFESAKCVDLCYGLAAENFTSSVDGGDGINNVKKGQPYLNVAKPTTDSKIKFDFKHALAKLKVQVDADVDVGGHSDGGEPDVVDGMTRVWVRSITFEGVSQRGFLNMRTGTWHEVMDGKKISHATVTIYDGRRDGSEAISDDTYEEITGFNSALVQSGSYTTTVDDGTTFPYTSFACSDATRTGVTEEYKDLFNGTGELMVIPANEQLKVTIVYDVETADATLPNYLSDGKTKGSTIENKITKAITLGGNPLKLESGNAYTINLHLGLNSVKFEADVSGWDDATGGETDLPANVPAYEAGPSGSPGAANITLPASTTTYQFAVSGLTANEAVTYTGMTAPITAVDIHNSAANSGGIAIVTLTINANGTVNNIGPSDVVTITGSSSNKAVTVNLTQNPAPLGLSVAESAQKMSGETEIVLSSTATTPWSSVGTVTNTDASSIFVYKNGTILEYNTTPGVTTFSWDDTNHKIVLGGAATAGDVFTITVQAGAADAETYSFTVKKKDATINTFSYASGPTVGNTTAVPTLTFKDSGDNDITSAVTGDDGYNVTYESSDTEKATVASDGTVTGVAAGTVTITVRVSDTKNYHFEEETKNVLITVGS